MVFPIRGHSYLECDRHMGKINSKSYTELPDDWNNVSLKSHQKPTPFNVINYTIEVEFKPWTNYLSGQYSTKCPISTRPIRNLPIEKSNPQFMYHKSVFKGPYLSAVITRLTYKRNRRNKNTTLHILYNGPSPIKKAKFNDLLQIKHFLTNLEAQQFYGS